MSSECRQGFTLIEVLVALVITGTVVTVFFQVLSAAMRLEYSAAERVAETIYMRQAYNLVMAQDVRDDDFQWEGQEDDYQWVLTIEPVETLKTQSESDETLQIDSELYRYVFKYQSKNGRQWVIERYLQHEPDYFSEDFQRIHF
ncbi:PulJ/GspJ family protein [Desulfonatronovibrio magnus]|uniref:PulJ/GspJ family protein n=1 Tax=Desulfonatronovibrio magnus TaxID=698827 RepID=UPI0018DEA6F0|nr:prepilin-type N-terminal cleavage/methylation domain-containing protein [Desulfonatronovibrio magnus]